MDEIICHRYGIDYASGVARFRGNSEIFMRMLSAFLRDSTFSRLKAAYIRRDLSGLLSLAHEMKGVSGNAALSDLYGADCALLYYLRAGGNEDSTVNDMFTHIECAYNKAAEGIHLLVQSKEDEKWS